MCTFVHILIEMEIEFDEAKRLANLAKHGIDFLDCESVFTDPNAITVEDSHHGEQRHGTVGTDDLGRLLVVAYTWRGERVRIISARKAQRRETRSYTSCRDTLP